MEGKSTDSTAASAQLTWTNISLMRDPYSSQLPDVRADITDRGRDMEAVLLVLMTTD